MKKILIIIPFLSVFLFLTSSFSVKANSVTSIPAFPLPVEGESSTHYLISFNSETGNYFLIKPLDPQGITVAHEGSKKVIRFSSSAICYIWKAGEGGTSWEKSLDWQDLALADLNISTHEFLYSSFDVFYSDGTIFFKRAPIKVSFSTQMKAVKMGAVMETVAKMVPMVMIAVVGFLGFRKALRLLLKVLHQA